MVQWLRQVAPTECAVSMVTVYELFCGLARALDPAKERQKVERFISDILELPLDRAGAEAAANIRAELERQEHPSGRMTCSSPDKQWRSASRSSPTMFASSSVSAD